jgi:LCP family protein required for cell wall assembly
MVLGSDWRASSGHRTDAIMLVSVNTLKQTVSAVSFPRDLYIPVPGWETTRINTVEPHGGFELLANTMEQNFGVRPSYYIMTDFKGFTGIIDSLGGVEVYAGSKLTDKCDLPQADGSGKCTIQPGLNSMDGATALWYIRSRYTSNDLDRQRREQEVLMGVFVKIMSMNGVENLPKFFTRFQSSVKTNLTAQAMTPLLPTAGRVFADRKQIHRYWLSVKEAKPYVTESGAQVLQPDYELIGKIMDEAVFNQ